MTNDRGEYRLLGLGAGTYEIKAELSGFATVVLSNLEFLVGQNATVPITMKVATLEEKRDGDERIAAHRPALGADPGNVDRRQMEELPIRAATGCS